MMEIGAVTDVADTIEVAVTLIRVWRYRAVVQFVWDPIAIGVKFGNRLTSDVTKCKNEGVWPP